MSLAEIVKRHQANMRPCETVDEDFFNDALDMSDECIDEMYQIYLAQDGCNRLSEVVADLCAHLSEMKLKIASLERHCG